MWEDESSDLCIEYVIFSEDNDTAYEDAMDNLFNGSSKIKEENGLYIYELPSKNDYDYAVCKVSEGFLFTSGDEMVIVRGNDLDELKEIAATAKFK